MIPMYTTDYQHFILYLFIQETLPARFCIGMQFEIIVSDPFIKPEDPIPAIALATINIFESVAKAHNMDPSSKRPRNVRNDHYTGQRLRITPRR